MAMCAGSPTGSTRPLRRGELTEAELGDMRADLTDVRGRLADVGVAVGSDVKQSVFEAAKEYRRLTGIGRLAMTVRGAAARAGRRRLSPIRRITPDYRARNVVGKLRSRRC